MKTPTHIRARLRFDGLEHEVTPDGSGIVSVRLAWAGRTYEGSVPCLETQQGVIKAASHATLSATLASTGSPRRDGLDLDVVGVKAVRAFDGWVVVTRLNGSLGEERLRLLGAAPCELEEDLPEAAARAVLDASNRVLGHVLGQGTEEDGGDG